MRINLVPIQELAIKDIFTYKAYYNKLDAWIPFVILDEKHQEIENISLEQLPDIIYGKFFIGCIGYNPSGWYDYKTIVKDKIKYM